MGSFGEGNFSKSENPSLNWVQRGIDKHNRACRRRAAACPFRIKLLCLLKITKPYYDWQAREPLEKYYDKP